MFRFMLFSWALVLLIDTAFLSIYVSAFFWPLTVVSFTLFYISRKLGKKAPQEKKNGLILGKGWDIENPESPKRMNNIMLEDKAIDLGFLAIGSPGSGKSVLGIIMLNYYTKLRKNGWVYYEGKGDLDIYSMAIASGCKPDYFFSSELSSTDTMNAFSGDVDSVIEKLTTVLIESMNEYYANKQRLALMAVVPLLLALKQKTVLRDLYVVLSKPLAALYVIQQATEQGVKPEILTVANDFFSQDSEDRANDIDGLMTKLSLFVIGDFAERINDYYPSLDLRQAANNNERIYLHLPYTKMAKDISILITEEIGSIARDRQLYQKDRVSWGQIFDDWGSFFHPNLAPISARCRSAAMPISFLFQSKGQTDKAEVGGYFTHEITDNIGSFISLRVNGASTKWVSEQFGTFYSKELTQTENSNFAGYGYSVRKDTRVEPEELKNLDIGEAMISTFEFNKGGETSNRMYRAKFPLPEFEKDLNSIDWPEIKHQKVIDDNCLNLWGIYMDADKLQELKIESIKQATNNTNNIDSTEADENLTNEVDYL